MSLPNAWSEAAEARAELPPVMLPKVRGAPRTRIAFDRQGGPGGHDVVVVGYDGTLSISLWPTFDPACAGRLGSLVRLMTGYHRRHGLRAGEFRVCLGDHPSDPGIVGFCSSLPTGVLVPDSDFIDRHGYRRERLTWLRARAWRRRIDRLYFRGVDTGAGRFPDRREAPRVAVALATRDDPAFDVKLVGAEPRPDAAEAEADYARWGVLAPRDWQRRVLDFRYQLDIDGNCNAWSGLYLKLLSGSPVLKVGSPFRQWYYDRLEPWVNYAPVAPDRSDLGAVLERLRRDEALSRRIGAAGRRLALSLGYRREMAAAADRLADLVS